VRLRSFLLRGLRVPATVLALLVLSGGLPLGSGQPLAASPGQPQTDQTGWFPFVLPWDDAAPTLTDASDLLLDAAGQDPASLIDVRGRVVTTADGHFAFSNTGRRARFWGTNLTFSAAFPPSPDYPPAPGEFGDVHAAEKLASRLAKLGFNAVRLHHMDHSGRPAGIWLDPWQDTLALDPVQLGRLDYLIYQLRRHAIYVDLNLHVSRQFTLNDGVTDADRFDQTHSPYNQGATLFDPVMIALQQRYVGQLLAHVNPYTGLAYRDDPAIFTVETTNEDSFGRSFAGDALNFDPADPRSFPAFYSQELDGWSRLSAAGPRINRLRNPGFEAGFDDWHLWVAGASQAAAETAAGGLAGGQALRVAVTQSDGVPWHVQLIQAGLALQEGRAYRLSFAARGDAPGTVYAAVMRDAAPWDALGWSAALNLTTSWVTRTVEFTATETVFGQARVSFDLGATTGVYWFDQFSFQEVDAFRGWQGWLEDRYGSTAALAAAWAPASAAPETELLANGSFEAGQTAWDTSLHEAARATWTVDATTATSGTHSLRVDVTQVDGIDWHVQLGQGGLAVQTGQRYRLRFDARASAAGAIGANVKQNHAPWGGLGLWGTAELTTAWQTFEFIFRATADDADAQVGFDIGQAVLVIWFDAVSLTPYNPVGLLPGESLEAGNVRRIRRTELEAFTPQRLRDTLHFYDDVQRAYFTEMRSVIRSVFSGLEPSGGLVREREQPAKASSPTRQATILGLEAERLASGFPLNTGTASDNLTDISAMADLDFVDNHYYWDHPWWLGVPAWSPTGWIISNQAWVNSPFAGLFDTAVAAVKGKPFTVTEFNQPFPNRYAVEAPIFFATVGAFQDWDGVFQFDYASDQNDYDATRVMNFFDLAGNPLATAMMPVAARLFLGGAIAPAPAQTDLSFTRAERYDSAAYGWSGGLGDFLRQAKGAADAALFGGRLRIADLDAATPVTPSLPAPAGPIYRSAGGQLTWDVSDPARGVFTFDGPQAQGAVGFMAGRSVALANLALAVSPNTAQFAAVTLQSRDGLPLATSTAMLLGVFTRVENTGQVWNAGETSLDDRWGAAPALIEPISLTLTLTVTNPAAVQLWALDATGAKLAAIPMQVVGPAQAWFTINTAVSGSVWYAAGRRQRTLLPWVGRDAAATGQQTVYFAVGRSLAAPALTAGREGQDVSLSWPPVPGAKLYQVYRAVNAPYFVPTTPYSITYTPVFRDLGATGDPAANFTYIVTAANRFGESAMGKRIGEFDFALAAGQP